MSKAPVPRPGILDIAIYVSGANQVGATTTLKQLSSNEGALGPSPAAVAALRDMAGEMHRYPDGGSTALREALAKKHGLDASRIVCGAGSDELIALLLKSYAGPGDEVLYSQHGFLMYPIGAKTVGATPVAAPETALRTDVDAMLAAVTPRTRVVFVANPNNPTGSYLPPDEIARLHAGLPAEALLIIDAAYAEYADGRNDYTAGIELVEAHPNVVMLRTFSKIYALAALRLGWAYCSAPVADVLNRVRGPFNVSLSAQIAGLAAVQDGDFLARSRAHNEAWLPWLTEKLTGLGLAVAPSAGNFVLVRFPEAPGKTAPEAWDYLAQRGVLIRKMASYGLPHSLRISVGPEEELQEAVRLLTEFLAA
jgi:histidinol-phosphate aminotransferase